MIDFKQRDKQLHFAGGCFLSFVFSFVSPGVGLLVAMAAGFFKEVYDKRHPDKHTADLMDMLATWFGGVVGFILFLVLSILERNL